MPDGCCPVVDELDAEPILFDDRGDFKVPFNWAPFAGRVIGGGIAATERNGGGLGGCAIDSSPPSLMLEDGSNRRILRLQIFWKAAKVLLLLTQNCDGKVDAWNTKKKKQQQPKHFCREAIKKRTLDNCHSVFFVLATKTCDDKIVFSGKRTEQEIHPGV
jgi:hypothetical protein